jgi:hypothetical protein
MSIIMQNSCWLLFNLPLYVWHTKMWIWKAAKMAGAACPTLKWQDRKTVGRAVPAIKLARLQHNSRSWCTAHIGPQVTDLDATIALPPRGSHVVRKGLALTVANGQ